MIPAGPRSSDSLIDISHESLIRAWSKLKEWVEQESRSARIYKRLADTAVLEAEGRAGLWRDPDLQFALTWREEAKPNPAWAQRYHPEFDRAMNFLDRSVETRDAERRNTDLQRKRAIKRTRLIAIIFGFLFLVTLVALFFANKKHELAQGLLAEVKQKAEEAKNNALDAERARLGGEEQARKREAAQNYATQSQDLANEALTQKGIAQAQTRKVIQLQRKAQQDANDAEEINALTLLMWSGLAA